VSKKTRDLKQEALGQPVDSMLMEFDAGDSPVKAKLVYRLSDLSTEDIEMVRQVWPTVKLERRRKLLSEVADQSEANFELDFTEFVTYTLDDTDPEVRADSIRALWHSQETPVMRKFIDLLRNDADENVRAAAAQALGAFILAGELEEIKASVAVEAVDAILDVCRTADMQSALYQRALESASFSGKEEVVGLIESAARHDDVRLQACALFAMGRSGDERWNNIVVRALGSDDPELVYEAARAAGELMIGTALPRLIKLARGTDTEIKEAAVFALGEIGGDEAVQVLSQLADRETDNVMLEAIEDALNIASLSSGEFGQYILLGNEDFEDDIDYDDDEFGDSVD